MAERPGEQPGNVHLGDAEARADLVETAVQLNRPAHRSDHALGDSGELRCLVHFAHEQHELVAGKARDEILAATEAIASPMNPSRRDNGDDTDPNTNIFPKHDAYEKWAICKGKITTAQFPNLQVPTDEEIWAI